MKALDTDPRWARSFMGLIFPFVEVKIIDFGIAAKHLGPRSERNHCLCLASSCSLLLSTTHNIGNFCAFSFGFRFFPGFASNGYVVCVCASMEYECCVLKPEKGKQCVTRRFQSSGKKTTVFVLQSDGRHREIPFLIDICAKVNSLNFVYLINSKE